MVKIHSFYGQNICSAPQNGCHNFSFVKYIYVDGEKLTRNGQKTATYYAASFLSHYRRVLFSHQLVFILWLDKKSVLHGFFKFVLHTNHQIIKVLVCC